MKCFPILGSLTIVMSGLVVAPNAAWASGGTLNLADGANQGFLFSAQGYLGVVIGEIDPDKISALRLKDAHGAEVVLVDHDAPAGKSGLKVHDVIVQLNGQPIESAEQFGRRLREIPSGRTITLQISRDGNPIYVTVQLCDQAVLEEEAWKKHFSVPEPPQPARQSFAGHSYLSTPAFLESVIPRSLYVGAEVNPVRTQLADYFGVTSGTGLLVENVDHQSPAARAGLKAGDVVVKVASQPMTSRGDWSKVLRNHRGQPVQVTIMRNRQEMVLTMSAGKPKGK
jgi:serine protease Do